jgi:hypothetical protein
VDIRYLTRTFMGSLTVAILVGTVSFGALLYGTLQYASRFRPKLVVGDEIRIWGGYSDAPAWLDGKESVYGTVIRFLPVVGDGSAALVALREPDTIEHGCHQLLLYPRFSRAWRGRGVVHIEAIDDLATLPPVVTPARAGAWVESHALYAIIRR